MGVFLDLDTGLAIWRQDVFALWQLEVLQQKDSLGPRGICPMMVGLKERKEGLLLLVFCCDLDSLTRKWPSPPVSHLQQPVQQQQNHNSSHRQHQHGNPNIQVPAGFACRSRGAAGLGGRSHRLHRKLHAACRTDDGLGPERLIAVWVWDERLWRYLRGGPTSDQEDKLHCCCFFSTAAMKSSSAEEVIFPSHRTRSSRSPQGSSLARSCWSATFKDQCEVTVRWKKVLFYADNQEKQSHNWKKNILGLWTGIVCSYQWKYDAVIFICNHPCKLCQSVCV